MACLSKLNQMRTKLNERNYSEINKIREDEHILSASSNRISEIWKRVRIDNKNVVMETDSGKSHSVIRKNLRT